jgi:LuxR family maltose regulon positive regulatory protein
MPEHLLATKLYLPPAPATLVSRSRLLKRLNVGLSQGRRLTLVSAPAGYGKTTLVVEWLTPVMLEARDLGLEDAVLAPSPKPQAPKMAWLSLDEHDNDLARFFAYLLHAFQQIHQRSVKTFSSCYLPLNQARPRIWSLR